MFSPNAKATAEKKTNHLNTALKAVRGDFRLSGKSELRQLSPFTPIDVRPCIGCCTPRWVDSTPWQTIQVEFE
jgi:hypothetical protein